MKGLLLLSGGFDSPVAYHEMKDLLDMCAIHFHYYPVTGKESLAKAKEVAKHLGIKSLVVFPIAPIEAEILKNCEKKYFFVLSKRFMMRVAEQYAKEIKAESLITGENLGQVASQTLENLSIIANAVKMPVYRPLLTWNKQEIMDRAKEIGTYDMSKGPELCNILGPKHPITRGKLKRVEREEVRLDVQKLVKVCLNSREIIHL